MKPFARRVVHEQEPCGSHDFVGNDATKGLFAAWDLPEADEMKMHLAEVLRQQGIGEGETAEFLEACLLVRLHISASAAADRKKAHDDEWKKARKRVQALQRAQDELGEILNDDALSPPGARILSLMPNTTAAAFLKSHWEFRILLQGAASFRRRLTEPGNGKDCRWDTLIGGLLRIYEDLGGQSRAKFRAGIDALNAALPKNAQAASKEAIRKRLERFLAS